MSKAKELSRSDYYEFRHYEKLMRKTPDTDRNNPDRPKSCYECPYHQPKWKFRTCTFSRCSYSVQQCVFRSHPLKRDVISEKAVRKNGL